MTTTTKRRPAVGDKVRLLRDCAPYKRGDIVFIMGDDHSYTPYYCKLFDNSFHWLTERSVELVEPVEPIDPLAEIKAAWAAGRRVRLILDIGVGPWHQRSGDCESLSWAWPVGYYEVETKPDPVPEPVDPLADVKAALKAGKRVRFLQNNNLWGDWRTAQQSWTFDYTHYPHARNRYEIEPVTVETVKDKVLYEGVYNAMDRITFSYSMKKIRIIEVAE